MRTTAQTKLMGCQNLKTLVEDDKLLINDMAIIEELYQFVETKGTYKADEGMHDDLVMTLVLFAWLSNQSFFKDWSNDDVRKRIMSEKQRMLEDDMMPFGVISTYDSVDSDTQTYKENYEIHDVSSAEFDKWLFR
jgi:hypothetical protein